MCLLRNSQTQNMFFRSVLERNFLELIFFLIYRNNPYPHARLINTTPFTACGENRVKNWPDTQGKSMPPTDVAEKNMLVFLPERCIFFSVYINSVEKIVAMKNPIPIVPAHNTAVERGKTIMTNRLRTLPVKDMKRIFSADIFLEIGIPITLPTAILPQKIELSRRALAAVIE